MTLQPIVSPEEWEAARQELHADFGVDQMHGTNAGGLTAGLPADAAVYSVELPRQVQRNPDRGRGLS